MQRSYIAFATLIPVAAFVAYACTTDPTATIPSGPRVPGVSPIAHGAPQFSRSNDDDDDDSYDDHDRHRRFGVDDLRRSTRPFERFKNGVKAGYNFQLTPCMTMPPLGGMGFHYVDTLLIDSIADARHPEALLYEPKHNGKLEFVAVEYVVPLSLWHKTRKPRLFGQDFKRNEEFQVWALHVWVGKDNPSGLFADWNPRVHCP